MNGGVPFEVALASRLALFKPTASTLATFVASRPQRLLMKRNLGWGGASGPIWKGLAEGKILCNVLLPGSEFFSSGNWRLHPQRHLGQWSPVFDVGLQKGAKFGNFGFRMTRLLGHDLVARCTLSMGGGGWPHFEDALVRSPVAIKSSNPSDGRAENLDCPPSLFMGHQLRRFSHFRGGNVQWQRYLEVKQDTRVRGQEMMVESERSLVNGGDSSISDVSEVTVICFDIETTGFSVANDRIIEFAARDLAGGLYSTIESLVNPQREVTNQHVHNISSQMVNNPNVPRWRDVALAILDFVESRRRGKSHVILVAHNGKRFDVPFITAEFQVCGLSIPSHWRFVDSMMLARLAMKNSGQSPPKTSLSTLFSFYNLQSVGQAHRAMADVNMLAQVLQMLMNDLEMSTAELLAQSFCAADVVKPKGSMAPIGPIVDGRGIGINVARLGRKRIMVHGIANGSASAPWDG